MSYQIELFQSLVNQFLKGESALLTTEGDVLGVKGENPVTYGTLLAAAQNSTRYLKLAEGDIVLLNDPYSGGSVLSEMTFVMAISEDLLWVVRKPLHASIQIAKSVEEEGLRIPPTPIVQKEQVNTVILEAIQAHPLAPRDFKNWILAEIKTLQESSHHFIQAIEMSGFTITGELIEEYLELCRKAAFEKINERSSGDTRVDLTLDSGETLRLSLEIHDGKINVDFSGTSATKTVSLTESATYGVCFYTLAKFYGFEKRANSGSFSVIQVSKPHGCWLVGKYPAATYLGMTNGVSAIESALDLALSQIHYKGERGLHSRPPLRFDLKWDHQEYHFQLPGGEGASPTSSGASASITDFSIENCEQTFPIKFLRADIRNSSGGGGKQSGGRGLLFKFEVLKPLEARWSTDLTEHRPRIAKKCSHGDVPEISVETSGASQALPNTGRKNFMPGDIVTLSSGSGGGCGRDEV